MECSSTEGAPTLLAEGRALLVSLPVNPCSRVGIGSLGQAPSEALSPRSARRRERCSIHEHQSSSTCLGAHDVYLLLFAYGAANGLREWSLSSRGGTVTRGGGVAATIAAIRRTRGPNKNPTKEQVAIRLDRDVLSAFRAGGPGWQTRMNAALKEWLATHPAPRKGDRARTG